MLKQICLYSSSNRLLNKIIRFQVNKLIQQQNNSIIAVSSNTPARAATTATGSRSDDEKWDICAGVLVERLPILSKELKPIEQTFQALLWQTEFENSLKSDHEMKHERDLLQAQLIKKGEMEIDLDDSSSKQTAQDLKDAYVEEFKNFHLANRLTEADQNHDVKSTNQKLDDILYLIIEQQFGNEKRMALPQGARLDGETMRQTAERILTEKCGNNLKVNFYGNAPCGFYKYKYPKSQRQNNIVGAKIFFYRTSLKAGNVDENITTNFQWHNIKTIEDQNLNTSYIESIKKFLFY